jgi:hypothetical protein
MPKNSMSHRERFSAVFNYQPADRLPVYYFSAWEETRKRWEQEGLLDDYARTGMKWADIPGMDPDWERGLWNCHDMIVHTGVIGGE